MDQRLLAGVTCVLIATTASAGRAAESGSQQSNETISSLVRSILLHKLPHEYQNTKQWGRTKEVWDGLKIRREGLRIKTKRRKKQANHGTWKRYKAWLIEPEEQLQIRISDVRQSDQGSVTFHLVVDAQLGAFARLSEWRRDVQLFSLSTNADATVRLRLDCEVGSELDFAHFPPDLVITPRVTAGQLDLIEFRLLRISNLRGALVRELGEELHGVLQDEINQRRGKLVERINRQLEKDPPRFSYRQLGDRTWDELRGFLNRRGGAGQEKEGAIEEQEERVGGGAAQRLEADGEPVVGVAE